MHRIDQLLDDLVRAASRRGISKRSLARQAGLHENTLAGLGKPGWGPSAATIRRLEAILLAPPGVAYHGDAGGYTIEPPPHLGASLPDRIRQCHPL